MKDVSLTKLLFDVGMVVCTNGVDNFIKEDEDRVASISKCLYRHMSGDWGDIHKDDIGLNEESIEDGTRIVSVYSVDDTKIWIITEADRSSTTILFPEEY